jgi:peptide deformylase
MYNLEILKTTRPLFERTNPFNFTAENHVIPDIAEFSIELCQLMWKEKAMGLAANQTGVPYAIFAMIGEPESFVCINPKIVHAWDEMVELEETSLSFPGLVIEKTRPKHLRLRFQAPNGEFFTRPYTGITARIIQQMMDHLNGVPFWDGISKLRWDMAVKKAQKLGFDYSHLPFKKKVDKIVTETPKPGFVFV